jgi:hypothetical protein
MKATHLRHEDKQKIAYVTKRFEIGSYELEYTVQYVLECISSGIPKKLNKKTVLNEMSQNLRHGEAAFNGLLAGDEEVTPEARAISRKLFPTFYND